MALELNAADFDENISHTGVTMVDFHAAWCGPCRMLGPIVESLSTKNTNDNVIIAKMDIDAGTNQTIAQKYGVRNIPTILFFKNGELVDRMVGVQNLVTLETKIETLISEDEAEINPED